MFLAHVILLFRHSFLTVIRQIVAVLSDFPRPSSTEGESSSARRSSPRMFFPAPKGEDAFPPSFFTCLGFPLPKSLFSDPPQPDVLGFRRGCL